MTHDYANPIFDDDQMGVQSSDFVQESDEML
jgi:hypothetical protein